MRKIALSASIVLCGCATHLTAGQLAARAMIEPTSNLCAVILLSPGPDVVKAAEDEIYRRHATCDWDEARAIARTQIERQQADAQAQQAKQANFMNALAVSGALLQQAGPRYYAPPAVQTTCVQQGVFTQCNSY